MICPMCLNPIRKHQLVDFHVVRDDGRLSTVEATLAECCGELFLSEKQVIAAIKALGKYEVQTVMKFNDEKD